MKSTKRTISVLLPSRGRPELLKSSIASLGRGDFEVLVRYDDDDATMPLKNVKKNVRQVRGERVGYGNFHLMINELAEIATGDWLMLWNDDAIMKTAGWSEIIATHDSIRPTVLNFFDISNNQNNLFPVMSRRMYKTIGHFSLSTHCDTWAQDVANGTGTHIAVEGIEAEHIRESLNDLTKRETQNTYSTSSPIYFSDRMRQLRDEDMIKIRKVEI